MNYTPIVASVLALALGACSDRASSPAAGTAATTPAVDDSAQPIAAGHAKFLGSAHSPPQHQDFARYWNKVTPENAGKWGEVEAVRGERDWAGLDAAYRMARDNGFPFHLHVLIWGNQQPEWIKPLPVDEQRAAIEAWFSAVAERYPDIDIVEVVNEPLHDPPSQDDEGGGNYINALGGTGETGWDWVLESFRLARKHFPNARLMLNEYSVSNDTDNNRRYLEIIELLKAENLIDVIGLQGHAFSTTPETPMSVQRANLDALAATGLPIHVTELDVDGTDDAVQLRDYQRIFPMFWEHPAVEGVTLWGFRRGLWRDEQGAYLIREDGSERPALVWLRDYVQGRAAPRPGQADASGGGYETVGSIERMAPELDAIVAADAVIERLAQGYTWSEGPVWIADGGYLLFTDVPENTIHRWSPEDGTQVFLQPSGYAGEPDPTLREAGANGLVRARDGSLLLADSGNRAVARLDLRSGERTVLASSYQGRRLNSPNDLVEHASGAVFFTDPPYGLADLNDSPVKEQPFNGVYRIDPDGSVHLIDDGLSFPNGIVLSPDQRTLYVANSDPERPIWMAYELDSAGNAVGQRVFADASDLLGDGVHGLPDGMVVAADGHLFATAPGGVLVFAADGRRLGRIATGTAIANCTLDDSGETLYLTSHSFLARVALGGPGSDSGSAE